MARHAMIALSANENPLMLRNVRGSLTDLDGTKCITHVFTPMLFVRSFRTKIKQLHAR